MNYFDFELNGYENLLGLSLFFDINKYEIKKLNNLYSENISYLKMIKIPIRCQNKLLNNNDSIDKKDLSIIIDKINIIKNQTDIIDNDMIYYKLKNLNFDTEKTILELNKIKNNKDSNIQLISDNRGKLKLD